MQKTTLKQKLLNRNVKGIPSRLTIPFLLLLSTVLVSSCYTTTMYTGNADANSYFQKVKTVHNHFLINGLVPIKADIHLNNFMTKVDAGKIETQFTFVDYLINFLTNGLYSRNTAVLYRAIMQDEKP